jgi:hypothetical protein
MVMGRRWHQTFGFHEKQGVFKKNMRLSLSENYLIPGELIVNGITYVLQCMLCGVHLFFKIFKSIKFHIKTEVYVST